MTKQERRKNIKNVSIEFDMTRPIQKYAYNRLRLLAKEYGQSQSTIIRTALLSDFLPLATDFENMENGGQRNDKEAL